MMARALCMSLRLAGPWVAAQRKERRRVVLAHGRFAPLGIADVAYLAEAGRHGDRLVVLVQAETWPLAREQAELVAAIRGVDAVVPHGIGSEGLAQTLRDLRPDVFVHQRRLKVDPGWCSILGIELVTAAEAKPQRGAA